MCAGKFHGETGNRVRERGFGGGVGGEQGSWPRGFSRDSCVEAGRGICGEGHQEEASTHNTKRHKRDSDMLRGQQKNQRGEE